MVNKLLTQQTYYCGLRKERTAYFLSTSVYFLRIPLNLLFSLDTPFTSNTQTACMRFVAFVSIILLPSLSVLAQKNVEDSLEKEIAAHPAEDTVRINLLQALCKKTYNAERSIAAANEIIVIAKKLNLLSKEGNGYMHRGSAYLEQGKDNLYLADLEEAERLYQLAGDKKSLAITFRGRGRYYQGIESYDTALAYHYQALEIARISGAKEMEGYIYSDIGNCYYARGIYPKAMEYYLKAQKIAEETNNGATKAVAIQNIALVNKNMKKYGTAIQYYRMAMQAYLDAGDSAGYTAGMQGIGITYDLQNKPDSALIYYQQALAINKRNDYTLNTAENYGNIGVIHNSRGNFSAAYDALTHAVNLFTRLNRKRNVKDVEVNIAELLLNAPDSFFMNNNLQPGKKYETAEALFKNILRFGEEWEDLNLQAKGWEGLGNLYEKKGDYKNAYTALVKKQLLNDSLVNAERIEETTRQTEEFEFEKKEAITKSVHLAEIKQEKTVRDSIAAGAGILLLGSVISFLFYKRKRDAVARQKEAEFKTEVADTEMKALRSQMNPHFIFNSLNSISDYIAKNNVPEADRYLSKFAKLMRLILENSEQEEVTIAEDLKALELYMQLEALRLNNKFAYDIQVDDAIDANAVMIPPLMLQPFVENSIWHGIAKKQGVGRISIRIQKTGTEMISCTVEDDGIGRKQSNVMKTEAPGNEKTSLGMKITQSRIDILNKRKNSHAAITVTDQEQGLHVEMRLPLSTKF